MQRQVALAQAQMSEQLDSASLVKKVLLKDFTGKEGVRLKHKIKN